MSMHCTTDPGLERDTNEDSVLCAAVDGSCDLVAVADGMGGHAAGDVASEEAVESLADVLEAAPGEMGDPEAILEEAFVVANEEIRAQAAEMNVSREPGTTLVAALVDEGEATIANVGDSRAYHFDGDLEQVTTDQSQVQQLVEAGELDPEEAGDHPMSHVLAQALGTAEDLDVDFYRRSVADGWLLLCSDGLTDPVDEAEIERTLATADDLETAASDLVDLAHDAGAPDNVSVALYEAGK